jgi:hypothetical protein
MAKEVYIKGQSVIATWIETDYKGNIQVHWASVGGENMGSFDIAKNKNIANEKLLATNNQLLASGYVHFGSYSKYQEYRVK